MRRSACAVARPRSVRSYGCRGQRVESPAFRCACRASGPRIGNRPVRGRRHVDAGRFRRARGIVAGWGRAVGVARPRERHGIARCLVSRAHALRFRVRGGVGRRAETPVSQIAVAGRSHVGRRFPAGRPHEHQSRHLPGEGGRRSDRSHVHGIRAAVVPSHASGSHLFARGVAEPGLGLRLLRRVAHGGRACQTSAREARP